MGWSLMVDRIYSGNTRSPESFLRFFFLAAVSGRAFSNNMLYQIENPLLRKQFKLVLNNVKNVNNNFLAYFPDTQFKNFFYDIRLVINVIARARLNAIGRYSFDMATFQ